MTRWLQAANGWHDAAATLPEIPRAPKQGVLSVVSVLSEGGKSVPEIPAPAPEAVADDDPREDAIPHGTGSHGEPRTWTGRVVSLADWRKLSEWERHGPNRRWFYGDTRQWEMPRDST